MLAAEALCVEIVVLIGNVVCISYVDWTVFGPILSVEADRAAEILVLVLSTDVIVSVILTDLGEIGLVVIVLVIPLVSLLALFLVVSTV